MTTINLENQFGEVSKNTVLPSGSGVLPLPTQATLTAVANLTAGTAAPIAVTLQALANKCPAKAGVTATGALGAVTVTTAGGDTYSDAALNTALATIVTQLNAVLAAIKVVS
jgi:hypothetical protein